MTELQRRLDALSEEIRHYPTPIARCDVQLAALLEERSAVMEEINRRMASTPCPPENIWINDGGFNAA